MSQRTSIWCLQLLLLLLMPTPAVGQTPAERHAAPPIGSIVLAADVEIALARSAGPAAIGDATVYGWSATGYQRLHEGTSPFTCLVNRDSFLDGYDALKPTCWDAEGSRSIVPIVLFIGELIVAGTPAAVIQETVEARFADRTFAPPATAGVAYMLQGDVGAIDPETGRVLSRVFPPHVMIYGPGVRAADLSLDDPAAAMSDPRVPFVYLRGDAFGYIIVRVPTVP